MSMFSDPLIAHTRTLCIRYEYAGIKTINGSQFGADKHGLGSKQLHSEWHLNRELASSKECWSEYGQAGKTENLG